MKPGQWRFISAFILGWAVISTMLNVELRFIISYYALAIIAAIIATEKSNH